MRWWMVIPVWFAVVAAGGAAPVPLSLEEAVERALARNRELAKGALEVQGAGLALEAAKEEVRGLKVLPAGMAEADGDGGTAQAGLRGEMTGGWGTQVAVEGLARQITVDEGTDARRGEVRVEVSQPLFRNFGSLMRDEPAVAAGESLRAARRAWERDRSALVLKVVEAYEGLIHRARQVACDEAMAGRLERLWALADARERLGRTPHTEVLRLELQRGEAVSRTESGRTLLGVEFQAFADLLGAPLDSEFQLEPPPLLTLEVQGSAEALAVALAERPDYAQALEDIETGDRQARIARRNLLPDVRVRAGGAVFGEGEDWNAAGRLDQEDWFVGLTAGVNLNLRGARLEADRADTAAEARRRVEEIVRHRLALEVDGALAEVRRTRAELTLAGRNGELAQQRAELARALFEAGRGSADTVSDAEADGRAAELAEGAARRDASVAAYRLLHALGTLVPTSEELTAGGKEDGR